MVESGLVVRRLVLCLDISIKFITSPSIFDLSAAAESIDVDVYKVQYSVEIHDTFEWHYRESK